jgi:hypothetical protein
MCKEMLVIPVNRVVDQKRIIEKNGGSRSRNGAKRDQCSKSLLLSFFPAKNLGA